MSERANTAALALPVVGNSTIDAAIAVANRSAPATLTGGAGVVPPPPPPPAGATKVNRSPATVADVPPAVTTKTLCAPATWAGLTAVICVAVLTTKLAAAVPPKLTAVAPVKPVPVIVTVVPPDVVPVVGLRLVTVGCAVTTNVYPSPATIADWPPGVVTLMSIRPLAWAGLTAEILVSLRTVKPVAAVAPNATAVAPVNP